jgi:hypothetical protein
MIALMRPNVRLKPGIRIRLAGQLDRRPQLLRCAALHAPPLLCQLMLWLLLQGGRAAAGSRAPAPLPLPRCGSAPTLTLGKPKQQLKRTQDHSASVASC